MVFERLYRFIPMLIFLAAIVVIVYLYMRKYSNPPKAKDFVMCILNWVFGIISTIGIAAVIYALVDKNDFASELFGTAALVFIIPWIGIRIWAWNFYKKNPKFKATTTLIKIVRHIRRGK